MQGNRTSAQAKKAGKSPVVIHPCNPYCFNLGNLYCPVTLKTIGAGFQITCIIPKYFTTYSLIRSCFQDYYGELIYPPSALKTSNYWHKRAVSSLNMFVWNQRLFWSQTNLCLYDKFSELLSIHWKNWMMNLHWYCCSTLSQSPLVKSLAPG